VTTELSWPLPCIVCGRKLEPVSAEHIPKQPYAGTTFISHGQYGSTVFDEMDRTFLELNVCDPCLVAAAKRGVVAHGTAVPVRYDTEYEPWDVDDDVTA
jgi:hypothetical protein